ncbi:NAD-binding protein [Dapis sp. BLCC M229]|uniref:NAD-binding protein n=1 Tax=Dapis sp. BLCC M229 TaxID=3400188 RepID=UPI003CF2C005
MFSSTPDHQYNNINPTTDTLLQPSIDRFLVCGLGSLGQHCVTTLKQFGVIVNAIDLIQPQYSEVSDLFSQLNKLIIGDAREPNILTEAEVQQCRAILIVTSNEKVNLAIALAARLLNFQIRLVVRSAKENLNQLLGEQLGNYVAFEPTELPAPAFAVAALEEEIIGFFYLEKQQITIIKRQINLAESWCDRPIYQLNNRHRKVISYANNKTELSSDFYDWDTDKLIQANDKIIYLEQPEFLARKHSDNLHIKQFIFWQILRSFLQLNPRKIKNLIINYWNWIQENPIRNLVFSSGLTLLTLLVSDTLLLWFYYPEATLREAFYGTAVLLLGGFGDIFGGIKLEEDFPWWLQFLSLITTLVGIISVALLNGLITERLLSTKFKFTRRNPIPTQDHVVIVGLGRVGQRVATLLQRFKQKLVAISSTVTESDITPKIPLVTGNIIKSLEKVNLATAKGIIAVTNDEMLNLEVALMGYSVNPNIRLVIRTSEQRFSNNLAKLLPYSAFICTSAVVAEAFAGAAFGENILSLFRIDHQTVLVTEYNIETGDTLNGLILAEIAYGYGVVPILYQKPPNESKLIPSDDIRLAVDDRLILLATINGLKRIENGEIKEPTCQVMIESAPSEYAIFQGANEIVGIAGCSMLTARELMNNLPGILPKSLYKHQAQRLVRTLNKTFVQARLIINN